MTDTEQRKLAQKVILDTIREDDQATFSTVLNSTEQAGLSRIEARNALFGYLSSGIVKSDIDLVLSMPDDGDPEGTTGAAVAR